MFSLVEPVNIPSRDQVQPGTKGSYEFVAKCSGVEWADKMKEID